MPRCAHCGGGKARRPCPALNANICSRCCGQHQSSAIACPPGCSFLRGAPSQDAYQAAVQKLLKFAATPDGRGEAAIQAYSGRKREVAEWEDPLLFAYVAYGYEDEAGQRAIDTFLEEHGGRLRTEERQALEVLRQTAWYSMFEVQEVKLDHGLELLDLATGEQLFVHEKSATHHVSKFDLNLAWVANFGDRYELTGAVCTVPRVHRDEVLKTLKSELKKGRKYSPGTDDKVLLRRVIPAVQRKLRKLVTEWQPPRMVTMDNEDIVFCEAVFDITDLDAVRAKLRDYVDLEEDGDRFVWLDRAGRERLGSGPLVLGSLSVRAKRLVLETQSKERLENGKDLFGSYLGDLVRHRVDSVQDLDVAMAENRERPRGGRPPAEIPPEVQAEVLGKFMQQRMMSWIDESIPMLKGKTPREVARTKAGKAKVLEMLKDQENMVQGMPGGESFDFSAVYEELGLGKP